MDKIKEENKDLIAARNNYYTVIIVVSGGIAGLILSGLQSVAAWLLFVFGLYLDVVFILKVEYTNGTIKKNIKRLEND